MSSKVLIVIIAIVVLAGAGGVYFAIQGRKPPTPLTNTITNTITNPPTTSIDASSILTADPVVEADNSKKRFAAVQEKVKSWPLWKQNATFSGLFMTFSGTLVQNSTNEIYVFDSTDDPDNHYTVSVAQKSGNMLRAVVPASDYQGKLKPVNVAFWQSNYVEALQLADLNGGKTFRSDNKLTSVDANLYRTSPNDFLYWVITYHALDPNKVLVIKIDAKTKTIAQ